MSLKLISTRLHCCTFGCKFPPYKTCYLQVFSGVLPRFGHIPTPLTQYTYLALELSPEEVVTRGQIKTFCTRRSVPIPRILRRVISNLKLPRRLNSIKYSPSSSHNRQLNDGLNKRFDDHP